MTPDDMEPHAKYEATVRIRRGGDWQVKPEVEHLDGRRGTFTAAWICEPGERYPGEVAMTFGREWGDDVPIGWIASGDLCDIQSAGVP